MLTTQSLLHQYSRDKPSNYFDSTLESKEQIQKFIKKLSDKRTFIRTTNSQMFFKNPFELFAAMFNGSKGDALKIKRDLITFVLGFPNWPEILPELGFLASNQYVVLYFVRHPECIIFTGLCLLLLAVMFHVKLKLFQMYQKKSLLTFELASRLETDVFWRVGIFLFSDAVSLCLLEKREPVDFDKHNFDNILEDLKSNNNKFTTEFSKLETQITELLTENLGMCPGLLFSFSAFVEKLGRMQHERDELTTILSSVKRTLKSESSGFIQGRNLKIETLGLDRLNPKTKTDLIFGAQVDNCIFLARRISAGGASQLGKPPGLRDKYTDLMLTHQTFENLERGDSLFSESKGTPLTTESDGRKYVFDEIMSKDKIAEDRQVRTVILDQNNSVRFVGSLKFMSESGKYGFFVKELDQSDVFFHFSELEKSKILLKTILENKSIQVSFSEVKYIGKHSISKKAVDIELIS